MLKRALCVLLILSILSAGFWGIGVDGLRAILQDPGRAPQQADQLVGQRLHRYEWLEQIAPALLLRAGAREQDGIFISDDYLLENIAPANDEVLPANLDGIEAFLDRHNIPSVLLLIPTAVAIKQQGVPALADLYNQKALISEVYGRFLGKATLVDAYPTLFAANDQYLYYRTESNLTGLGGYYIYTALASRLGITPRPLSDFSVEHLEQTFYGDLAARTVYKGISPDIVSIYSYEQSDRQYRVTHTLPDGSQKSYHSLFPHHAVELYGPQEVVLGGFSPLIDITVASPYDRSALLFADKTVLSYLPFLLVHYSDVTVVDLERVQPQQLADIDYSEYDQVMFIYSVDSFIDRPVCTAAATLP